MLSWRRRIWTGILVADIIYLFFQIFFLCKANNIFNSKPLAIHDSLKYSLRADTNILKFLCIMNVHVADLILDF